MLRRITLLLGLTAALGAAVVIDQIAVIVGKHVIKASDIVRDLRLTDFLNNEALDFSPGTRRKSAERLIDQTVIGDSITNGGYKRPPESDAHALLNKVIHDRFGGSQARLREALSRYGVTEDELEGQLLWQLTVLRFIDQRFRPEVMVSDDEVRAFYNQRSADLRREYPQNHSFTALAPKIRNSLEGERINQDFENWIAQARKRTRIEYRQRAFQ